MKKFLIAATVSVGIILPGASAQCDLCPDGITAEFLDVPVPVDATIPLSGSQTCSSLSDYAETVDGSNDVCGELKKAESLCCVNSAASTAGEDALGVVGDALGLGGFMEGMAGNITNPCSICPGGATVAAEGMGASCPTLIGLAKNIEASDEECASLKQSGSFCCPESAGGGMKSPCPFCEGMTVKDDNVLPEVNGVKTTCGQVVGMAKIIEESDENCTRMKQAQTLCCPESIATPATPVGGTDSPGDEPGTTASPVATPATPVGGTDTPGDESGSLALEKRTSLIAAFVVAGVTLWF